jgi:hypothetical protein
LVTQRGEPPQNFKTFSGFFNVSEKTDIRYDRQVMNQSYLFNFYEPISKSSDNF